MSERPTYRQCPNMEHQCAKVEAERDRYKAALVKIQNAYGSPYDEDEVTTTAREALQSVQDSAKGDKNG